MSLLAYNAVHRKVWVVHPCHQVTDRDNQAAHPACVNIRTPNAKYSFGYIYIVFAPISSKMLIEKLPGAVVNDCCPSIRETEAKGLL